MTKYLDNSGLEHFLDNIKGLMRGPSYQQIETYLDAHPEATTTVQDRAISTEKLGNKAVTTLKLGEKAVTTQKMADNAVTTVKLSDGAVTDAKLATQKVNQPLFSGVPTNGTSGQVLRTLGDGTTEWATVGLPSEAQTSAALSEWLEDHPDVTTTVQNNSITLDKLSPALANSIPLTRISDTEIQQIVDELDSKTVPSPAYAYDTAADMQADPDLTTNMIVHTNGFSTSGDGKAAWYKIKSSGTANGTTILALQNGLKAVQISENNSVATANIQDGAVTDQKLASNAVNAMPTMTASNRGVAKVGTGLTVIDDALGLDDNVSEINLGKNGTSADVNFLDKGMKIYAEKDGEGRIYNSGIESGNSYLKFAAWSSDTEDHSTDDNPITLAVQTPFRLGADSTGYSHLDLGGNGDLNLIGSEILEDGTELRATGISADAATGRLRLYGDNIDLSDGNGNNAELYGTFSMSDLANAIPVTLYHNEDASASATAILSEPAANFKRLTIFYKDDNDVYGSVEVWNPAGKRACLSLTWISGTASPIEMYQRVRWVIISGSNISTYKGSQDTNYRTGQVKLGTTGSVTNNDYISITHVIGYR